MGGVTPPVMLESVDLQVGAGAEAVAGKKVVELLAVG